MDLDFFKQTRILDGGMGQELLARGMRSNGTLWSANAILDENYHFSGRYWFTIGQSFSKTTDTLKQWKKHNGSSNRSSISQIQRR